MKIEHALMRDDLNLDEICARVSERVGRPLGLVARKPTGDEHGVLIFEEMGSDERVALDPRVVASVVDGMTRELEATRAKVVEATRRSQASDHVHRVPEVPDVQSAFLTDFDAAATDADRLAVFRAFLAYGAGRESEYREQIAADIAAACESGEVPCTLEPSWRAHGHGHGHGH